MMQAKVMMANWDQCYKLTFSVEIDTVWYVYGSPLMNRVFKRVTMCQGVNLLGKISSFIAGDIFYNIDQNKFN